jgi:hypothetical protein
MNVGDLIWRMIVGCILFGGTWLAIERIAKRNRLRAGTRRRGRVV